MIAYSNEHQPPAPALQVTVSSVVTRRLRRVLPALLDTGADVTAVQLTIAGITFPRQEVVLTELDFVVLGRDVLNRFNLHLYGPRLVFEIDT